MATAPPTQPPTAEAKTRFSQLLGRLILTVLMIGGLGVLLLALAGVFRTKVPMETVEPATRVVGDLPVAEVKVIRRPRYEKAVGTVRPVHETAVASKLLAKVVEVKVKAGQTVTKDEVLIRLDDADLAARYKQTEAAFAAAKSSHNQALTDYKRAQQLLANKAISQAEYDRLETAVRTTAAEIERAQEAVREAKVLLDYATIRAPMTGIVIDKRVEVGDTVAPGQVLLTIYDPTRMQMVVTVRESLAERLKVDQKVLGRLESLRHECEATISEIVPEAQTASRSFTVKVTGPCPPGTYSGMFGRIFIPLDDEEVIVVPRQSVVKAGQLDLVDVVVDGKLRRRSVRLGRRFDQDYEVLSGLKAGEKVVLYPGGKDASR